MPFRAVRGFSTALIFAWHCVGGITARHCFRNLATIASLPGTHAASGGSTSQGHSGAYACARFTGC
jgi:hypothetical protein